MDAQRVDTALPLLTREKLCRFYRPLGNELPKSDWNKVIGLPWNKGENAGAVVHVILWESSERVALVANKKDQRRPEKKLGVGLPSEEVLEGEMPFNAATKAVHEELNLFNGFQINPEPLTVRKDYRNVIHITFQGTLEEYTELPKIITDPDGEIEGGYIVNPYSTIRIKRELVGDKLVFTPMLGERMVYPSHLGLIALSMM